MGCETAAIRCSGYSGSCVGLGSCLGLGRNLDIHEDHTPHEQHFHEGIGKADGAKYRKEKKA